MPVVHIHMIEGRTVEQKRALVSRVTQAVSETINCPPEAVKIVISNKAKEDYAIGGVLKLDEKK